MARLVICKSEVSVPYSGQVFVATVPYSGQPGSPLYILSILNLYPIHGVRFLGVFFLGSSCADRYRDLDPELRLSRVRPGRHPTAPRRRGGLSR